MIAAVRRLAAEYAEHAYAREWRRVARAAGIPDNVCNFDVRAGAFSEADDAGADIDLIRSAAGHNKASITARYIRGTTGKSRKVASKRITTALPVNGTRTNLWGT
jgi:hypothetical protein